jgi:hypothetical protein
MMSVVSTIDAKRMGTLLGLALAAVLVASVLVARPAHANTFSVNSTGDENNISLDGVCDVSTTSGNQCTLRAALQEANFNQTATVDDINFNIPGSEVHTIKPGSPLPDITDRFVNIDGYSQPGASPNTLQQGTNAALKIELDGSNLGFADDGLRISNTTDNVVIRGLMINNFKNHGIRISGQNNKVEGNFIGTDAGGFIAKPNTNSGVFIFSDSSFRVANNNTVGGTAPFQRNLISGNFGGGVEIKDGSIVNLDGVGNKVEGNLIGTDKDGTGRLGNGFDGVSIITSASDNTIGGTSPGSANTIAFNQGIGVSVSDFSVGNRILHNSIFSNAGVGIDLNRSSRQVPRDGVTANDTGDADTGANNFQNFPLISSAKTARKGTSIAGKLNSIPNKSFTLEFFASPEADPSGNGEGKTFLGEKVVATDDSSGNASFTFQPALKVSRGQFITATATADSDGNTSEFSNAKKVVRKR